MESTETRFWLRFESEVREGERVPIPAGFPSCLQLWFQSILWDSGSGALRWAERCDPAWFF